MESIKSNFSICRLYINGEEINCAKGMINRFTSLFKYKIPKTKEGKSILNIKIDEKNINLSNKICLSVKKYLTNEYNKNAEEAVIGYKNQISISVEKEKNQISTKEQCVANYKKAVSNPRDFLYETQKTKSKQHPLITLCKQIFEYSQTPEQRIIELFCAFSKTELFEELEKIFNQMNEPSSLVDTYTQFKGLYTQIKALKEWDPKRVAKGEDLRLCKKFMDFIEKYPEWLIIASEKDVKTFCFLLFDSLKQCAIKGDQDKVKYVERILIDVVTTFYNNGEFDKLSFFYSIAEEFKDEKLLKSIFNFRKAVESAKQFLSLEKDSLDRARAFVRHLAKYPMWILQTNQEELEKEMESLVKHANRVERDSLNKMFDFCAFHEKSLDFLRKIAIKNPNIFDEWCDRSWSLFCNFSQEMVERAPRACFEKITFLAECNPKRFFELQEGHLNDLYYDCAEAYGLVELEWLVLCFMLENLKHLPEEQPEYLKTALNGERIDGKMRVFASYQQGIEKYRLRRYAQKLIKLGLEPVYEKVNAKECVISLKIQKRPRDYKLWVYLIKLLSWHKIEKIEIGKSVNRNKLLESWMKHDHFKTVLTQQAARELLEKTMISLGWSEQAEALWKQEQEKEESKENAPLNETGESLEKKINRFGNRDL